MFLQCFLCFLPVGGFSNTSLANLWVIGSGGRWCEAPAVQNLGGSLRRSVARGSSCHPSCPLSCRPSCPLRGEPMGGWLRKLVVRVYNKSTWSSSTQEITLGTPMGAFCTTLRAEGDFKVKAASKRQGLPEKAPTASWKSQKINFHQLTSDHECKLI